MRRRRNGRALLTSLALHGSIAVAAIVALQSFHREPPGEKAKLCIAISHFAQPVAKAPKVVPEPVTQTPPKPEPKKKPKPKPKPEPVVEKPKEPQVVKTPEPVVQQEVQESEPEEIEETENEEVVEETEAAPTQQYAEAEAAEAVPAMNAGERYLEQHLALIAKMLQEHLYYPRIARKRGITGEVVVAFELLHNGRAVHINVVSGDKNILNEAAITTIERLSGRFPKPSEPLALQVPILYELK